ncbi:hypothetical protein BaRGS_00007794 [Batillaria attramentaria]|uniref:Uncharacterized protein n=1 Tax=Batillaria attramentaria TaxID=370345 RepID=A0ABD0LMS5_9CAEN
MKIMLFTSIYEALRERIIQILKHLLALYSGMHASDHEKLHPRQIPSMYISCNFFLCIPSLFTLHKVCEHIHTQHAGRQETVQSRCQKLTQPRQPLLSAGTRDARAVVGTCSGLHEHCASGSRGTVCAHDQKRTFPSNRHPFAD